MQMGLYAPAESAWRYAEGVSFAWYWFAAALRRVFALSPEQFPVAINAIAVLASTIGDVLLVLTAATAVSIAIAVLGTLFWRFTPEIWEVGTYGHPVTLALPLFLAAVFILAAAPRRHERVLGRDEDRIADQAAERRHGS